MSEKDIEDRLRSHAKALDSLLNLIPAKLYYNQDNSDQWKKRKQTREESQAAKRAKLDPDQPVTVKEVEEDRARQRAARDERKRKLNDDGETYETKSQMKARKKEEKRRERKDNKKKSQGTETIQAAADTGRSHHASKRKDGKPNGVLLKVNGTQKSGKAVIQKAETASDGSEDAEGDQVAISDDPDASEPDVQGDGDDNDSSEAEQTSVKRLLQTPKSISKAGSKPQKFTNGKVPNGKAQSTIKPPSKTTNASTGGEESSADDDDDDDDEDIKIHKINGLASTLEDDGNAASPAQSNNTDNSSTLQKSLAEKLKTSRDPAVQQQLKERLAKRIEELRQARKADGGEVPRNRTELMEQRRKRDDLRKERKKQMRIQAKAEAEKNGETIDEIKDKHTGKSTGVKLITANYSFGQVNFDDGEQLNATLDGIKAGKKKKGPRDVLGAIKHIEAKKSRLSNMTDDKKADIQEKDRWSKALKMASGEKLQDDETLLKKSLKRQEKAKKKSEREWKDRNANVEKGKVMRQKKREANLAARKEQKKNGKSGKKTRKVPSKKSKGRAGFEGTGFGGSNKKKMSKS